MATIPNLATMPTSNVLTLEELKEALCEDDFYWVELKHDTFGVDEDEVFNLRLHIIWKESVDFSTVRTLIPLSFDDYGHDWRIWNLCPTDEMRMNTDWE